MPSAFAALRLITSSIFTACWTGRSAGLLAPEDAVDVLGGVPVKVQNDDAVGYEQAAHHHVAKRGDGRQATVGSQSGDELVVPAADRVRQHDETTVRLAREVGYCTLDITRTVHARRAHRDLEWRARRLCGIRAN